MGVGCEHGAGSSAGASAGASVGPGTAAGPAGFSPRAALLAGAWVPKVHPRLV